MFKPGLFSIKQLFTATLIGGPLLAGFQCSVEDRQRFGDSNTLKQERKNWIF